MASTIVELESMIGQIGKMAGMAEHAAPAVVRAVEAEIHKTIAAGTDPYGEPWQLTLKGKVPLRNAANAVTVEALGRVVSITISGIEAKHHYGAVRGKIRRRVIPSKKLLPEPIAIAVKEVLDKLFMEAQRAS